MKRAMLSLVLGAAPAALAGQVVTPGAVTRVRRRPARWMPWKSWMPWRRTSPARRRATSPPFFTGRGGLVARAAPGARRGPLTFALTCGDAVLTRTVTPDGEGIVRQAFTRDNGLACAADHGKVEISGIAAGGWYWINDDPTSALASLFSSEVLGFEQVKPVAPGGVTIVSPEGGAASFIKHEASGRVAGRRAGGEPRLPLGGHRHPVGGRRVRPLRGGQRPQGHAGQGGRQGDAEGSRFGHASEPAGEWNRTNVDRLLPGAPGCGPLKS